MKKFRFWMASCLMLAAAPWAQASTTADWPTRPITLVVPYTAGGAGDAMARLIGENMTKTLAQPVIVDNRPGAGANLGTAYAARAPGGHTILLAQMSPIVINPHTYGKLSIDPMKELTPVAIVSQNPMVLVVRPGLPIHSLADLVAYAKANPGKLNYASSGNGSLNHVSVELLKTALGVNMVHIPYKGGAPAMQDILSGQVDVMIDAVIQVMPMVREGRLRALAVTGPKRLPSMPDVPTVVESGIPNYVLYGWMGIFAPSGMPPEATRRLKAALDIAIGSDKFRDYMVNNGSQPVAIQSTEVFKSLVQQDYQRWEKVVKDAGIRAD